MKNTLAVLVLALMVVSFASAQTTYLRIDDYPMGAQGRVYPSATQAGDTIVIPIPYVPSGSSAVYLNRGQWPDSIKIGVFGASDSMGMDIDVKFSAGGSAFYAGKYVDSLSTLGTKGAYKSTAISKVTWFGYDNIGIAVLSRALGAAGRAKTPTRAWVRVERYFVIPPK